MSKSTQLSMIYRQDYRPADYFINQVTLRFELAESNTTVQAVLQMTRNPHTTAVTPLVLHGQELQLQALSIDGRPLTDNDYQTDADSLTIHQPPEQFELIIVTRIQPKNNTSLEGLYQSSGNFCTQCEAEGFRKITYFLDRPDVMAVYTTTIIADKTRYPVLLANGNLIDSSELDDGRHWVKWYDPFKKPSYLFALVAGQLDFIEDHFNTRSGRDVTLRIYVGPQNINQCEHAMASLKKAMLWDEQVYSLEYDLDIYMIVAVGDFNMGAMENKGLNIFNTKFVLAKPESATDSDYHGIEGVIAHEYFHNWTGNRVTCRDWFQLSLKEGLTVFRDQEFSADMGSRGVKRIDDVRVLRSVQFPQDAGPMAHPVRPDAYIEINNFYTVTIYNKGAEVVRMMHTLLGVDGFRRGMDCYFARHDGEAVSCDDFVAAMEAANNIDLTQFRYWYSQAGTPELSVTGNYNQAQQTYTLTVSQRCPGTPGQTKKQAFHIPLAMGLLGTDGRDLPLQLDGENSVSDATSRVLQIDATTQQFTFINVPEAPVPSLLRGFSAPVKLQFDYSNDDLLFLLANDSDAFNRWEASQQLIIQTILNLIEQRRNGITWALDKKLVAAFAQTLSATNADPALLARIFTLPGQNDLAEQVTVADVEGIHLARQFVQSELAQQLRDEFFACYRANHKQGDYDSSGIASGKRSLKNRCLAYLATLDDVAESRALLLQQYQAANNMTDEIGALSVLVHCDWPEREPALATFYQRWQQEALVVDKWFSLQAMSLLPGTLHRVQQLLQHDAFALTNPNKVRGLIGAFAQGNPLHFHAADGSGYAFIGEQILVLDPLNPQVAARLMSCFTRWRKYDHARQELMRAQLKQILAVNDLSPDVYEIAAKSLDA